MRIPIVNEQDELLYYKNKDKRDPRKEITRASALWLFNNLGEVLIARRSHNKKNFPNFWGPSVAGSLEEGETYESNLIKETQEEIGLNLEKFVLGPKIRELDNHEFFGQYFFATIPRDIKFQLQSEEVAEVKWITLEVLQNWYTKKPEEFLPTFQGSLNILEDAIKNKKTA